MDCALILLAWIGKIFLLVAAIIAATLAVMFVGFSTAWMFGWASSPLPTIGFCLLYTVLGLGGVFAYDECRKG